MNLVRTAYLETAGLSLELLQSPEIEARWEEPSALAEFSVRGLAGHLVRATTTVEYYLDQDPAPAGEPIDAATYYARAVGETSDVDSELNRAIRDRGEKMAAEGLAALIELQRGSLDRLKDRLDEEPADRKMRVHQDLVLLVDEYLVTRLVELTVHIDDLAVSVDLPTPDMPAAALDLAFRCLIDVARTRGGDIEVLRALARQERADLSVLRVL